MRHAMQRMSNSWDEVKKKLSNSTLLLSVLINVIVFIVIQICFEPRFETNDDNYMASILYGASGEYSSRLVFVNIVIGKILKTLLQLIPGVYWYTIFHYAVMFAAFVVIFYVLFEVLGIRLGMLMNGILSIFFVYEAYVYIQFSKTAGISVVAGMILIFYALEKDEKYAGELLAAITLILLGSMIRFSVFEMLLVVFFGVGLFQCVKELKQSNLRKIGKYVAWFVCVFIICFGFRFFDNWAYNSVPEWQEYRTFNALRANLLDYGFPDYEENVELYNDLAITADDLEMYRNWDFADPEKFNESVIRQLISAKEKTEVDINFSYIAGYFQTVINGFVKYHYFAGIAIVLLLWCMGDRHAKFLVLYEILAILGIEFYCFYRGRYLANRIDYNFFLAVTVVVALLIGTGRLKKLDCRYVVLVLGITVLANRAEWIGNWDTTVDKEVQKENREFFDMVDGDKEHLYLAAEYTQDDVWVKAFPVFELVPKGISSNYYVLGGWGYRIPGGNNVLANYQVTNPFRDMVDNENVYFIDNLNSNQKIEYIRRYYSEGAYASWAKYINGVSVFRVVTHEPELDVTDALHNEDVAYSFDVQEMGVDGLMLEGYVYLEGTDSYNQDIYIGLKDKETGVENYYYTCQLENENYSEVMDGKFSGFERYFDKFDLKKYEVNLYLENETGMYAITAID